MASGSTLARLSVKLAGMAAVKAARPVLVTVIVYCTGWPGWALAVLAVFTTLKSRTGTATGPEGGQAA